MDSPLTGLIILAGLCVDSWWLAVAGTLGLLRYGKQIHVVFRVSRAVQQFVARELHRKRVDSACPKCVLAPGKIVSPVIGSLINPRGCRSWREKSRPVRLTSLPFRPVSPRSSTATALIVQVNQSTIARHVCFVCRAPAPPRSVYSVAEFRRLLDIWLHAPFEVCPLDEPVRLSVHV